MNKVAIGVGSNIDPVSNISKARTFLINDHRFQGDSSLIVTEPIGNEDQPLFVNGAFLVETFHEQAIFKEYLQWVERSLGRPSGGDRTGPRTIDLDIVVWNGLIVDEGFYTRDFLHKVVLEIWPDLVYEERVR